MPATPTARPTVRLVELSPAAIHALAAGDLAAANRAAPVLLTPYFVGREWASLWRMRSAQVESDPSALGWITRVVVADGVSMADGEPGVVGRAGFHGPPDAAGMVEVGYAIDPPFRRRGFARAALEALLDRAAREPGVRTVRATISPENAPSRALVLQYGFARVGEQWDEEDGLETIFEVPANRERTTTAKGHANRVG